MFHLFAPSEAKCAEKMAKITVSMKQIDDHKKIVRYHRKIVNQNLVSLVASIARQIKKYKCQPSQTNKRKCEEKLQALQEALMGTNNGGTGVYWGVQSETPGGNTSKSDYILPQYNIGFLVTGGGSKTDRFVGNVFYWKLPEREVQLAVGMFVGVIIKSQDKETGYVRHTMERGLYCVTQLSTVLHDENEVPIADSDGKVIKFAKMTRLYVNGTFQTDKLTFSPCS